MKTTPNSTERLLASVCYALGDTRIEVAGVMRCCLATVSEEYQGKDGPEGDKPVTIGMTSACRHCKQAFTLVEAKPHPKWKPDWQLNGHNVLDQATASKRP
jgi:hypothetical protein